MKRQITIAIFIVSLVAIAAIAADKEEKPASAEKSASESTRPSAVLEVPSPGKPIRTQGRTKKPDFVREQLERKSPIERRLAFSQARIDKKLQEIQLQRKKHDDYIAKINSIKQTAESEKATKTVQKLADFIKSENEKFEKNISQSEKIVEQMKTRHEQQKEAMKSGNASPGSPIDRQRPPRTRTTRPPTPVLPKATVEAPENDKKPESKPENKEE